MLTQDEKRELAEIIVRKIKENFSEKFISGNLRDTIQIHETEKGIEIEIPAEKYDLKKWNKEKVIVYTGTGSYAQSVDEWGGFSHTHKNYVEVAIHSGIVEFLAKKNKKGGVVEIL